MKRHTERGTRLGCRCRIGVTVLTVVCLAGCSSTSRHPPVAGAPSPTVWLCRPGMADNPCTVASTTTVVSPTGATTVVTPTPDHPDSYACFFVYGTVSQEAAINADLSVQRPETEVAETEASPFSPVCQVYAPIYRQVTVAAIQAHPDLNVGQAAIDTAYDSVRAAFYDFLNQMGNRPFVLYGGSQGAAMLNLLIENIVDPNPALRARLVAALIIGGNVEVPTGKSLGATFKHVPLCSHPAQSGCVIAYSSFPSTPPADSLFGRPGQGISLASNQKQTSGLQVACVNPAGLSDGAATTDPMFPTLGKLSTPWVSYPGLYTAECEQADGASWLNVARTPGRLPSEPLLTEDDGPAWGYHVWDIDLAFGNLVSDVQAAENTWSHSRQQGDH